MSKDIPGAKSLGNTCINGAEKNVADIVKFGNGDMFQLLCKASSEEEGWMKSTKAMEINKIGCVVQVTTQQGNNVAEAVCFVPGAVIVDDNKHGGRKLVYGGEPASIEQLRVQINFLASLIKDLQDDAS